MKENSSRSVEQTTDAVSDRVQATTAPLAHVADPHTHRLARLKVQIQSGTYSISSRQIADKLIQHMAGSSAILHPHGSDKEEG